MNSEDRDKIDNLSESLYSRGAPDVRTRRKLRFGNMSTDIKTAWDRPAEDLSEPKLNEQYEDHSMSFITKIFIGSIIFCVAAVGLGAYLFFNGNNLISADNINISINGPVSIPGGTPVTFDIAVKNNNSVDLAMADLAVSFPSGATDPANPTNELGVKREFIGDIPAGGEIRRTVQAIIFGEENVEKSIEADLTYQIKDSSSSYTKKRIYSVLINSSPVNMSVSSFKEITSGQEFDLKVTIKSNSTNTLKNVLVSASYPFGYTFLNSDLKSLPDNATWRIGDIPAGAEKTIIIHGKLQGEDTDSRVFRFNVGAQNINNPNVIGTQFVSAEQDIVIQKPFMTVGLTVDNNDTGNFSVAHFNQPVRVELSWFNNLPSAVSDAQISVKLAGTAYDRSLVQTGDGYFKSSTDEIIWNQQTLKKLAAVGAGEGGSVNFTVTPRDMSLAGKPVVNPTLSFTATVSGRRTQETGVPESLTAAASRSVRISTAPSLSGAILRNVGPFNNTGPIPPKADEKSTYTVVWTIDNTNNSLDNVAVTATLPPYVSWLGNTSPDTEDVSYSTSTNSIAWNAGTVGTYTASNGTKKQLYFQVSVLPSVNQINNAPTIVNDATLNATDHFTGEKLTATQSYLTTRF
ncbi:MAG: hypothetical protein M1459_01930, partial [Patescibacteria group bacterium]|nr:hypothetical protein [Patescibacteria group bacterium]